MDRERLICEKRKHLCELICEANTKHKKFAEFREPYMKKWFKVCW